MSIAAMKQALEALEANLGQWAAKTKVIPVLRQAIAEAEQKPVQEPVIDKSAAKRIATLLGREPKRQTEMTSVIIGVKPKSANFWAGMRLFSYGEGDEPAPDMLLDRGRATLFESEAAAMEALRKTLMKADAEGMKWQSRSQFVLIKTVPAP